RPADRPAAGARAAGAGRLSGTGRLSGLDTGQHPRTPANVSLGGYDGDGVTIALLDTGVDIASPFLHGHVLRGIDVLGGHASAAARRSPADQAEIERHGTEMAGLLVGAGGPEGAAGIAAGATLLPIRVAGWQREATGRYAVYARSDQILAGIERAVDPN